MRSSKQMGSPVMTLSNLFFGSEAAATSLTPKELAVLDGIDSLGPVGACCGDLCKKIKHDCGSTPRLATLYFVLKSLERKGLVTQFSTPSGGRPLRLFQITEAGMSALALGRSIAARLTSSLAQPA